jgi:hypothetical protein
VGASLLAKAAVHSTLFWLMDCYREQARSHTGMAVVSKFVPAHNWSVQSTFYLIGLANIFPAV